MLMKQNVNNDVTKDSPIGRSRADLGEGSTDPMPIPPFTSNFGNKSKALENVLKHSSLHSLSRQNCGFAPSFVKFLVLPVKIGNIKVHPKIPQYVQIALLQKIPNAGVSTPF